MSVLKRTYTYKLYPTLAQIRLLEATIDACRGLYNACIAEHKQAWEERQEFVKFRQQFNDLPDRKRREPHLKIAYAQVLQNVVRRVDVTYSRFFLRRKAGEKAGYPRFKGKRQYNSITYPQWGRPARFVNGKLRLCKIGSLKVSKDRPLRGKPKTCTVARKADGWYAYIVCDVEPCLLPPTAQSVGIDLGIESFATLSTGETIPNPRYYRHAERRMKTAQRKVTRRQKGSHRREKARILLAKIHLKTERTRRDFCHKAANSIIKRYDHIAIEKLYIPRMLKLPHTAKSIEDVGWGIFTTLLSEKAESAARTVTRVYAAHTSQLCARCGERVPKAWKQRWHSCPSCGYEAHRDYNAALNILQKGGGTAFGEAAVVNAVEEPSTA